MGKDDERIDGQLSDADPASEQGRPAGRTMTRHDFLVQAARGAVLLGVVSSAGLAGEIAEAQINRIPPGTPGAESRGRDKVVSREQLLRSVWGYGEVPLTRTVDHFIARLRSKIESDPHHPRYLHTVYGDGYRLSMSE